MHKILIILYIYTIEKCVVYVCVCARVCARVCVCVCVIVCACVILPQVAHDGYQCNPRGEEKEQTVRAEESKQGHYHVD